MKSFRWSGKRHLLLTGGRQTGKTTLLSAWWKNDVCDGIKTTAIPGREVRLRTFPELEEALIGTFPKDVIPFPGGMRAVPSGFLETGVGKIRRFLRSDKEWFFLDEIGYLESEAEAYQSALFSLLEQKRIIGAVRKQDTEFIRTLTAREDVFLVDLDHPYPKIGAVLMVSGEGKRFGENKLLKKWDDRTLGEICISRLTLPCFTAAVAVTRHEEIRRLCEKRNIPVVFHSFPEKKDTIRLGIEWMEERYPDLDGWMFLTGDQPMLADTTIEAMVLFALLSGDKDLLRLSAGKTAGNPVIFAKRYQDALKHLKGTRGGREILERYADRVEYLQTDDPLELEDIDTRRDWERLKKEVQRQ